MAHSSSSPLIWTQAWKGYLPARAIVMARRATPPPSPSTNEQSDALGHKKTLPSFEDSLDLIATQLTDCTRCKLCEERKSIVLGEGNPHAELVFVGEGPGEQEDLLGRPFMGKSGQLLNRMIEAMGLKREHVYIVNVVKCRPPEHRNPEPDEIQKCSPFLARQLAQIQPKVIVALGKSAAQTLLQSKEQISTLRGKFYPYGDNLNNIQIMPTFDPSYLLKNPASKRETWADLQQVAKALGIVIPKR